MTYRDILHEQLPRDEAIRRMPYDDATGQPLVPGTKLVGNITIGIGRNLSGHGVNDSEIEMFLENDITAAEMAARDLLPNFDALSDVRKAVIVNMAFNLGYEKLRGFTHTLAAIRDARWDDAATLMLDSDWAREVKTRALRLSAMMRSNTNG